MDVLEAIRTKRAVRQFKPQRLTEQEVRAILNAGRRSQSSKNTQPWRFIAIQEPERLQQVATLGQWAGHLAGAALGVFILTPDPTSKFQVLFDAGQCASYMQLAAWDLGIGSCIASIYEAERAREMLGFPPEYHARFALSFGYPLEPDAITRPPKKGGREPFDEVVHFETW